ncbi:alpha/beta fold hydrolase [Streptococcus sp. DD13]|uniref:alpha/beta fold hydrolase n=1 Tax=Streptococcus sp. DD13 TaxID=1777881 RepID=UPI000797A10E|nr:alpha/beta fold hydrolase [Streptococcus sp. DD13]KXT77859.1 Lysophospholipase L2 [Streptococcus sp. DD13]
MKKGWIVLVAVLLLTACNQEKVENKGETDAMTSAQTDTKTGSSLAHTNLVSERYDVAYGDKKLYGVLTAPAAYKEQKLPLLVLSHGFNNTLENYEEYAQKIAEQGYLVYRFDFYGGSTRSKSGGEDMLDMSVKTEVEDLTQVVAKLSGEKFVDKGKILLLGASQGGVVSTLYAAEHPEMVHKLMLIFPAFVLFDDVRETYANYRENPPEVVTHRNAQLGRSYLTDALAIDIKDRQKRVTAPTLIIQGTADTVVPYRYAQEASKNIPDAQLVTVDGGGHWIDASFNKVAFPAIESFLKD